MITPIKVYCDNRATISIANNPVLPGRTQHIKVDKHFIKEKLYSGMICMTYIPTTSQVANILTRGLPKAQFENLVTQNKEILIWNNFFIKNIL